MAENNNSSVLRNQTENVSFQSSKSNGQDSFPVYKEYPYKIVIVIIFCLAQAITSIIFPTLTPIAVEVQKIYEQSSTQVTSGALLYLILHPVFTIPANIMIDQYGVHKSIIVGSILQIIGSSARIFVNYNFSFVILGFALAGVGRPFIVNAQGQIVGEWFFPHHRTAISSLFSFMLTVSQVGGILIPGFIFGKYKLNENKSNLEQGKTLTKEVMEIQAILSFAFLLPNILLMRDRPQTPPSHSATVRREDTFKSISQLFKNSNYVLLWFTYSIVFGSFNAIAVVISYIVHPFDFDPQQTSVIGAAPVATGMIGSLMISYIVKKNPKFQIYVICCIIGSLTAIATFLLVLHYKVYIYAILGSLMIGLFMIPSVPLMLELGIQISFPVGQGMSVGMLFAGGQLFGAFISLFLEGFIDGINPKKTYEGGVIMVVMLSIAAFLMFFLQEDLARLKAERIREAQKSLKQSVQSFQKHKEDLISIQNLKLQQNSIANATNKSLLNNTVPKLTKGSETMNQNENSNEASYETENKNLAPLLDQSDLEYLHSVQPMDDEEYYDSDEDGEVTKKISIISQNAF